MAVLYTGGSGIGTTGNTNLIIDETGATINTVDSSDEIVVYSIGTDSFVAITGVYPIEVFDAGNTMKIYSLPGTIPCNSCSSTSLGMMPVSNGNNNATLRIIPNPSNSETHIYYTISGGLNTASIRIIDVTGKVVDDYKVTTASSYVTVNTSNLTTGIYYCTLKGNGINSVTQKMIINH